MSSEGDKQSPWTYSFKHLQRDDMHSYKTAHECFFLFHSCTVRSFLCRATPSQLDHINFRISNASEGGARHAHTTLHFLQCRSNILFGLLQGRCHKTWIIWILASLVTVCQGYAIYVLLCCCFSWAPLSKVHTASISTKLLQQRWFNCITATQQRACPVSRMHRHKPARER